MKKNLKKFYFRPDFYFETANDFCLHLGYSAKDIADLTGVHPRTAEKWIKTNKPPPWLLPFLYAVHGGVISSKDFYGWRLHDGYVYAPGIRDRLTCSEVESLPWFKQTLKQSHAQYRELKKIMDLRDAQASEKTRFKPKVLKFKK